MATSNPMLDLAFAMDCTNSMGSYIKSATDNIRLIVDEIVTKETVTVRLALIEYRDHPPQCNTFVTRVHSFTNTVAEMKGWLEQCSTHSGGDVPEAVADALNDALNLPWRSKAAKIVILISDAPPHGLDPKGDAFPNGCPAGFDPLTIARKMAEKNITLYTVGVEPPILPYRDFFMTLAHITGGQYVPMVDANRLAQMIIAGVREEISLDRLVHTTRDDITRVMRKATTDRVDDLETASRLQQVFTSKKMYVSRMNNAAGVPSKEAEECYSKCVDMADIQKQYKKTEPVSNTKTVNMDYNLEEEKTVSIEQAKRIVQKAKNWNYSTDAQTEQKKSCKYGGQCYNNTSHHRLEYSHPDNDNISTRHSHETKTNDHTTRNREKNSYPGNDSLKTACKYGGQCNDNTSHHRLKFSHPDNDNISTRRSHETKTNDHTTRNQQKNSYPDNDSLKTACKYGGQCYDNTSHHRLKFSHPNNNNISTRRSHETKTNDHTTRNQQKNSHLRNDDRRIPCKHGVNCNDRSDYHRGQYSHPTA